METLATFLAVSENINTKMVSPELLGICVPTKICSHVTKLFSLI